MRTSPAAKVTTSSRQSPAMSPQSTCLPWMPSVSTAPFHFETALLLMGPGPPPAGAAPERVQLAQGVCVPPHQPLLRWDRAGEALPLRRVEEPLGPDFHPGVVRV